MSNSSKIIAFKQNELSIPTDLMTLRQIGEKYNFKYHNLRNLTHERHEIPYYDTGILMVSESEFVDWLQSHRINGKGEK